MAFFISNITMNYKAVISSCNNFLTLGATVNTVLVVQLSCFWQLGIIMSCILVRKICFYWPLQELTALLLGLAEMFTLPKILKVLPSL
jgi:hypothetical protein